MKSQGEKKESKKVEGRKEGRRKDDEFRLVSWSLAATCWIPSQETANRNTLRTRWLRRFSLTYFWLGFEFHFYMQKLRVRCYPYGCHEGTRQTENSANTVSSKLNYCNYLRSDLKYSFSSPEATRLFIRRDVDWKRGNYGRRNAPAD